MGRWDFQHNYDLQGREESPCPRLPTPNKRVRSLESLGQQKSKENPANLPIIMESRESVVIEEEQEGFEGVLGGGNTTMW